MRDAAPADLAGADLQRLDGARHGRARQFAAGGKPLAQAHDPREGVDDPEAVVRRAGDQQAAVVGAEVEGSIEATVRPARRAAGLPAVRLSPVWLDSEEHTSELQSLMRISYAVFCLKKKKSH